MRYVFLVVLLLLSAHGFGADKTNNGTLNVVTTFSILADMVEQVGGDRVEVHSLVAWDQDPHVYQASPKDIKLMRNADVLVVNGLGFEFWSHRLVDVSGFSGVKVVATQGVDVLKVSAESGGSHQHEHTHQGHEHHNDSLEETDMGAADPHAWHSIEAAKVYLANISDALITALPDHQQYFMARQNAYLKQLSGLQEQMSSLFAQIPAEQKRVMVPHDAFAYLARDFGLSFFTLQGVSTNSDMSAADFARVVRKIKQNHVQAIYSENVSNNKLIKQVVRETGVRYGGELISGALSVDVAPSYLDLMRYNLNLFFEGMK